MSKTVWETLWEGWKTVWEGCKTRREGCETRREGCETRREGCSTDCRNINGFFSTFWQKSKQRPGGF